MQYILFIITYNVTFLQHFCNICEIVTMKVVARRLFIIAFALFAVLLTYCISTFDSSAAVYHCAKCTQCIQSTQFTNYSVTSANATILHLHSHPHQQFAMSHATNNGIYGHYG